MSLTRREREILTENHIGKIKVSNGQVLQQKWKGKHWKVIFETIELAKEYCKNF